MPGILPIIEAVATNPVVESSISTLLEGLLGHFTSLFSSGAGAEAVQAAVTEAVGLIPQMTSAVVANTPAAPAA